MAVKTKNLTHFRMGKYQKSDVKIIHCHWLTFKVQYVMVVRKKLLPQRLYRFEDIEDQKMRRFVPLRKGDYHTDCISSCKYLNVSRQ